MKKLNFISSEDVLEALRLWHGGEVNHWPLAHLRLGLQLDSEKRSHRSLAEGGPAAQNRAILNQALGSLKMRSPEAEDLLRERFENRRDVLAVANSLNVSESSLYYRQRQAVAQLAEILVQLEENAGLEWQERMLARLAPPSYHQLVGIEQIQDAILSALLNVETHFIVSIDGIGGIGKTALADHITRRIVKTVRFDEVVWVTAKHTHLSTLGRLQIESGRPALTFPMLVEKLANQLDLPDSTHIKRQRMVNQYIKERACLVIIDNLETVADYRNLLPELQKLQSPSKFLLTSRIRLLQDPGVFSISLRELELEDAIKLMRIEAVQFGFSALVDADDKDLAQIYEVVGGNPLALKLIIGQLRIHSLPRVLKRFGEQSEKPQSNEGIFDYIYQEIWDDLGDTSKATLLALTQAGESGFVFDHLVEISGLEEEDVSKCLEELIQSSLVDLSGTIFERRYRLHRLTEVFLLRMLGEG